MPFERTRRADHSTEKSTDVRLVRLPRVYRPAADSMLLARSVAATLRATSIDALELCAGTGYVSLQAARLGVAVTAVDVDRRSVANIRLNARLNRLPVTAVHADVATMPVSQRFDLVFANPPYVPTQPAPRRDTAGRAWNAGPDGRIVLDAICRRANELVRPGGTLVLVQSDLSNPDVTCLRLRNAGFTAAVTETIDIPFGPVLSQRLRYLLDAGLIAPGNRTERVSAIVGTLRTDQCDSGSSDDRPAAQELIT